jgi:sugar transferase (PEP-CTERM/EpsH1 system associated)
MTKPLRVLVVSPDLPYPPSWGFGVRVYQLLRALAAESSVTLLCYARPDMVHNGEPLREFCTEVRVVPRNPASNLRRRAGQARSLLSATPFHASGLRTAPLQAALDDCLRSTAFDVVQLESSQLASLRYRTAAALVIDEHNIESELLQRMGGEQHPARRLFNLVEAAKYRRLEQRAWSRADACVTTSDRDERQVQERMPGLRTAVVPNGVDPDHFSVAATYPRQAEPVQPDTMVFNGVLTYRPNLEGIRYFIDQVLPRIRRAKPNASLTVVGYGSPKDLAQLAAPGVTVTGWVDDVRPYLARAAAIVVPIRMGGGTRLKVVEALSMARPVVSTTVGCEGIDVEPGRHLLVADQPEELAAAVCRALDDPDLGIRLGSAGRDLVVERYSWQRAGQRLCDLYGQLVPAAGPHDPAARGAVPDGRPVHKPSNVSRLD